MSIYFRDATLVVFVLWNLRIWRFSLVKDTVFWFIGTAFVSTFNANTAIQDLGFFKKTLLDNLKFVLVIEFVLNLYTFSLPIELMLVPFLSIVVMFDAFAQVKQEYSAVKKITDFILALAGIVFISYSVIKIIADYRSLATSEKLAEFVLPPLMTLAYTPFLFFFALFLAYENLFFRIDFFVKNDEALNKLAKRKVIRLCKVKLHSVIRLSKSFMGEFIEIRDEEELGRMIEKAKKCK